jgi:hypothetical protein
MKDIVSSCRVSIPDTTFSSKSSQISSKIQAEISQADTLIIAGFFPDKKIIDYMKKPIHIICFVDTIYRKDEDEDDTIISYLYDNPQSTDIADITFFDYELKKHSFKTISDLELFNASIDEIVVNNYLYNFKECGA